MADELIALFRENNWVLTNQQLVAAGLSPKQIVRLTRRGILTSPRRGTFMPGTVAESASADKSRAEALRVSAVIAASSMGVIASHRSAAIMHGLDLLTVASARVVTVTQPRRGGGSRSGYPAVRVRTAEVPQEHVTTRFGVPCTTVARTVIDLARNGSFDAGVVVADNALHAKKTTRGDLEAILARCSRWPGIATARRAVEFSDERAESVLESLARVIMAEHDLDPPELQVWVGGEGSRIGRVDFLWRKHRTIAEADGKAKYEDPRRASWQLRIKAAFERASRLGSG
ncbi:MAG: type IV toxin-antitoxin system AbiEi family antitoxin domain-containing protein [Streptosporangiaceae bacterium]|nr:type IV toxin-antitoxin system AbiEi family antitoxin domain-containing protein [Streptosporangiaceae bacterium]